MTEENFIGVVCGLKSEAGVVRRAVAAPVRIGVSGADAARAEEIARTFCAAGAGAIVSVGVSGGLDPALAPGDLLIGESVIADDGSVYESDPYLLAAFAKTAHGATQKAQRAALFGADDIIDSVQKKAALRANHGAAAVDMESHGAARAAKAAGVPFIAIRAIADPAGRALPPAALSAVAPDGSTRVLKTLGAALADPRQFSGLMTLGRDSAAATAALQRALGPLFASLEAALAF